MRFLSLSRPWPWAIFHAKHDDLKDLENRYWRPPDAVIGQRIALHAAKSWDDNAIPFFLKIGIDYYPDRYDAHPFGVIVGVATVDRAVTDVPSLTPRQRRWYMGPTKNERTVYGWVLTHVQLLSTPIAQVGAQGIRELAPEKTAAIEAQIGRWAA